MGLLCFVTEGAGMVQWMVPLLAPPFDAWMVVAFLLATPCLCRFCSNHWHAIWFNHSCAQSFVDFCILI